mmetsp:Transcript_72527/g.206533  ORF Transcript_72527/g.206533 Transcript_72527/m.206533 type:complete len:223 (+) Transcript_72527:171-839(+)
MPLCSRSRLEHLRGGVTTAQMSNETRTKNFRRWRLPIWSVSSKGLLDELAPLAAGERTSIPLKEIRVLDRVILQLVYLESRLQVAIDQRRDHHADRGERWTVESTRFVRRFAHIDTPPLAALRLHRLLRRLLVVIGFDLDLTQRVPDFQPANHPNPVRRRHGVQANHERVREQIVLLFRRGRRLHPLQHGETGELDILPLDEFGVETLIEPFYARLSVALAP